MVSMPEIKINLLGSNEASCTGKVNRILQTDGEIPCLIWDVDGLEASVSRSLQ